MYPFRTTATHHHLAGFYCWQAFPRGIKNLDYLAIKLRSPLISCKVLFLQHWPTSSSAVLIRPWQWEEMTFTQAASQEGNDGKVIIQLINYIYTQHCIRRKSPANFLHSIPTSIFQLPPLGRHFRLPPTHTCSSYQLGTDWNYYLLNI